MKKTLFFSIIFISLGLLVGDKLYKYNKTSIKDIISEKNIYFLQEGVYEKKENLDKNIKNLDQKVVEYKDKKYYVYVGITKDKNIAYKLKEIYTDKGLNIYIKEKSLSNEEFLNNVEQFDLLIKNATTKEEILTIEEVVLASYSEILQKY